MPGATLTRLLPMESEESDVAERRTQRGISGAAAAPKRWHAGRSDRVASSLWGRAVPAAASLPPSGGMRAHTHPMAMTRRADAADLARDVAGALPTPTLAHIHQPELKYYCLPRPLPCPALCPVCCMLLVLLPSPPLPACALPSVLFSALLCPLPTSGSANGEVTRRTADGLSGALLVSTTTPSRPTRSKRAWRPASHTSTRLR